MKIISQRLQTMDFSTSGLLPTLMVYGSNMIIYGGQGEDLKWVPYDLWKQSKMFVLEGPSTLEFFFCAHIRIWHGVACKKCHDQIQANVRLPKQPKNWWCNVNGSRAHTNHDQPSLTVLNRQYRPFLVYDGPVKNHHQRASRKGIFVWMLWSAFCDYSDLLMIRSITMHHRCPSLLIINHYWPAIQPVINPSLASHKWTSNQ